MFHFHYENFLIPLFDSLVILLSPIISLTHKKRSYICKMWNFKPKEPLRTIYKMTHGCDFAISIRQRVKCLTFFSFKWKLKYIIRNWKLWYNISITNSTDKWKDEQVRSRKIWNHTCCSTTNAKNGIAFYGLQTIKWKIKRRKFRAF